MLASRLAALSAILVAALGAAAWVWDNSTSYDEKVDEDLLRMGGSLVISSNASFSDPYHELLEYSVKDRLAGGYGLLARPTALRLVTEVRDQGLTEQLSEAEALLGEANAMVSAMTDDDVWAVVEKIRRNGFSDIADPDLIGSAYEAFLRSQRSGDLERTSMVLRHICVELTKFARGTQGNLETSDPGTEGQTSDDHEYYVERARRDRHKAIQYCTRAFDSNESSNNERPSQVTVRRLEDIHQVLQTLFEWNGEPDRGDEYLGRLLGQLKPIRLAHELRNLNWVLAAARMVAKSEEQKSRLAARTAPAIEKALILAEHLNNMEKLRELNTAYGALLERQGSFAAALPYYQAAYEAAKASPNYREESKLAINLKELSAYPGDGDPLDDAVRQLAALPPDTNPTNRAALETQRARALFRHQRRPEGFAALLSSLDLYKSSGNKFRAASVLLTLSEAAEQHESLSPDRTPISYLEEAGDLYSQVGDEEGEFTARYRIAKILAKNGDEDEAIASFERLKASADARNEEGRVGSASMHLTNLFRNKSAERALEEATECWTAFERAGIDLQMATCLVRQGKLLISLDRKSEACAPFERAKDLYTLHAYPFLARDIDGLLKRAACQIADSD